MAIKPIVSSRHSGVRAFALLRQRCGFSPWLIAYFLVVNLMDAITTHIGLSLPGFREGNGIGAWVLHTAGEPGLYAFKTLTVVVVLATVVALAQRLPGIRKAIYFAAGLVTFVVLFNILAIYLG